MKIRSQRSAGAICYRRTRRGIQYLLLSTVHVKPGRTRWEFPKGKVEPGETNEAAARREVFEETGIQAEAFAPGFTRENRYRFRVGEELIDKTVVYYVNSVALNTTARISEESKALRWVRYQAARRLLSIKSLQDLLDEAHAFITGVPKKALRRNSRFAPHRRGGPPNAPGSTKAAGDSPSPPPVSEAPSAPKSEGGSNGVMQASAPGAGTHGPESRGQSDPPSAGTGSVEKEQA